ncbi:hypothetical protein DNTS_035226 [Danionella cerebrum]|nr:hypothetical protein DNTS_035226 [Danionella translucida]
MATLTGAQGISTGRYHAAVMTNSEQWEAACVRAGRSSGDLAHPLDRENAQSSCAGLFIASHLGFSWPGIWVHVDIASPVHSASEDPLLNSVSPLGVATARPPSEEQMERDCKRRRLV